MVSRVAQRVMPPPVVATPAAVAFDPADRDWGWPAEEFFFSPSGGYAAEHGVTAVREHRPQDARSEDARSGTRPPAARRGDRAGGRPRRRSR